MGKTKTAIIFGVSGQELQEVEEFAYLKSKCGQAIKQPTKGWSHRQLHRGAVPKAGHHEAPKLYEGDLYINVNIKNTHDLH